MRIDSHFHIWDLQAHRFPWLQDGVPIRRIYGDTTALRRSYLLETYLQENTATGVAGGVYVQCGMEPPLAEAKHISALLTERAMPFAITGYVDFQSEEAPARIADMAQIKGLKALRYTTAWHANPDLCFSAQPEALRSAQMRAALEALQEQGLRFEAMLHPAGAVDLLSLIRACPKVPVVLNHMLLPFEINDPGLQHWRRALRALAAEPRVFLKLSGIAMWAPQWWRDGRQDALLREAVALIGPERCMIGSNAPVDGLHATPAQTWAGFDRALAPLSGTDRELIFGGTARRFYDF